MNKEREVGLLEQLEIACIRPKKYNELLQNKKSKRWRYILVLAFLLVFIEAIIPMVAWDVSVGGLKNFVEKGLPAFEITSKGLNMEDEIEIKVPGVAKVIVDPNRDAFTKEDIKGNYSSQVLISKNNALFINMNLSQEVSFASLKEGVIDNSTLVSMIPMARVSFALYLVLLVVTKIVVYLWWTLVFAFICRSVVKTDKGKMVTMSQAFEITFYARTLSEVISSVNVCLGGFVDGMSLLIASVFLTMGYIRLGEISVLNSGAIEAENE